MSTFDPQALLSASTEEANDTRLTPVPPGNWTAMVRIGELKQQPQKDDPSKLVTMLQLQYEIQDQEVKDETGIDTPMVRDMLFLDVTDEGGLDSGKGKNVQLGRIREALGLNEPGKPFALNMLDGQPCQVEVVHNPKPGDPTTVYTNVRNVAAL